MKRFIILIFLAFIFIPDIVKADAVAEQEVILDFPIINAVDVLHSLQTAEINSDNGKLSREIKNTFSVSSNYSSGSIAEFKVLVESDSGLTDGMAGVKNNKKNGKIVLTNIDAPPDKSSIADALSKNPTVEKNKNVIAYKIIFNNKLKKQKHPVFSAVGSSKASARVINKPGTAAINVSIKNNSSYLNKTFSNLYDNAGTYQAIIYCTVYTP